MSPTEFEKVARRALESHYRVSLGKQRLPDHPKTFDFVSDEGEIVGDAKFYSLVRGEKIPPAKWATISEHCWLLEKTSAKTKFIVFGNDRRVPEGWLHRWGKFLPKDLAFFFCSNQGELEVLGVKS